MLVNQNGNYGKPWIVKKDDKQMIAQGIKELKSVGMHHVNNFLAKYKYITASTFRMSDQQVLIQLNDLIFGNDKFKQVVEAEEKAYPAVFDLYDQLVNCKMNFLTKKQGA